MIDESCCKQYEPSIDVRARRRRDKGFAFLRSEVTRPSPSPLRIDGPVLQPAQQLRSCNSEETRIVVTLRDLGTLLSPHHNLNTSPVPPEINRRLEGRQARHYDKTIQHVAAILPRLLLT